MPKGREEGVYERPDSKVLWIRYYNGTKLVRVSSGTSDRKAAEEEFKRRKNSVGKVPFSEAYNRFVNEKRGRIAAKTLSNYETSLRHWGPFVVDLSITDIDRDLVKAFITVSKRNGASDVTIRRDIAFMSSLLTTATEWPDGIEENPILHLKKKNLKEASQRTQFVSPEEFELLLAACPNEQWRRIIILAVETGMRDDELRNLKWEQIDLKRRVLYVVMQGVDNPNYSDRTIPLSDRAVSVVSTQPRHTKSPYFFWHGEDGDPYTQSFSNTAWDNIRLRAAVAKILSAYPGLIIDKERDSEEEAEAKKAELQKHLREAPLMRLRFHDLRHTFASWWIQRGGDERRLQEILGHRTPTMTKRYSHLRVVDLSREMRRVEDNRHLLEHGIDTLIDTKGTD